MTCSRWLAWLLLFSYGVVESIRVTLTPAFFQQLTSANYLHYTIGQYGLLFLPFSIAALISSLTAGKLIEKKGLFAPFLIAILCDLASLYFIGMAILANYSVVYSFISLLVALFLSGVGFGIILTVVSTFISQAFPKKTEVFITSFYLSLSLGSLLLFISMSFALNYITVFMWILVLCFIAFYFLFNYFEIFPKAHVKVENTRPKKQVWTLVAALIVIGILESLFFNWTMLYLEQIGGFDTEKTGQIYLSFLIFFTVGQVVLGGVLYYTSFNLFFILIPLLLTTILFIAYNVFAVSNAYLLFGVIGCFLSCNLPFVISYGKKMYGAEPRIFGPCIAAYTFGYGAGSYGFGVADVSWKTQLLPRFFLLAATFALLILIFNIVSMLREKKDRTLTIEK
jgi:MFS family permease